MYDATKTSKDFARIAGKKIIHKSAEATGDLVSNKIADKITSMGKQRSKKEKDEKKHNGRNTTNLYSSRKEKANN